ncbi:MAG: hypothetical protein AB202_01230 [Parcubacteria bacterium C7867-007]|nr:MAG: hypothetical protein AB202_01230 [Parcubacteria bacterium C7867-007]
MKHLDPKSFYLFFVGNFISYLFVLFFAFIGIGFMALDSEVFSIQTAVMWSALIALLLLAFSYLWAKLTYQTYKYELTDLGFKKESGVIYKRYVTIPYARIQNVDINRGILDRLLGLSSLNIQTAGSSGVSQYGGTNLGAEGILPGLTKVEAEMMRDDLIRRTSGSVNQGL